jgi:hypothetical protein
LSERSSVSSEVDSASELHSAVSAWGISEMSRPVKMSARSATYQEQGERPPEDRRVTETRREEGEGKAGESASGPLLGDLGQAAHLEVLQRLEDISQRFRGLDTERVAA